MKSMIRWPGLIVFLGLLGLLTFLLPLLAGHWIEIAIESAGTRMVGARVDLAEVDLSLWPSRMTLTRLAVTDPEAPLKNAVEIGDIHFSFDLATLLQKKILVDQLTADNVRFNTDRAHSGALKQKPNDTFSPKSAPAPPKNRPFDAFRLPSGNIQDVETILKTEAVLSWQALEKLAQDIQTRKETFAQRLETLPDQATFRQYEARLEKIKDQDRDVFGVLSGYTEANALYEDIKADLEKIRAVRRDLRDTLENLTQRLAQIPQLIQKDVKRLKSKYALTPEGLGNISRHLFGPRYAEWVTTGLNWYQKILPWLNRAGASTQAKTAPVPPQPERGQGINIAFGDQPARPKLRIRRAGVSMVLAGETYQGTIQEISTNQALTGQPLTLSLQAGPGPRWASLIIGATLDHTDPDHPRDTLQVQTKKLRLEDLVLSDNPDLALTLAQGLADLKFNAIRTNGQLSAETDLAITEARFTGGPVQENDSRLATAVQDTLSGIFTITGTGAITGTLENYQVNFSTNLDRLVKQAVSAIARQESRVLAQKLQSAIRAKANRKQPLVEENMDGLENMRRELTRRLQKGQALL